MTGFLLGLLFALFCVWRWRQIARSQHLVEVTRLTELLETRVRRWNAYWAAVINRTRALQQEEANEVVEETVEVFEGIMDQLRRTL